MISVPWKPFIAPTDLQIASDGGKISFRTLPKTDWWRTGKVHSTSGAYVAVEHDTLLKDVKSFKLEASIEVEGGHQVSREFKLSGTNCGTNGWDPILCPCSPSVVSSSSQACVTGIHILMKIFQFLTQRPSRSFPLHFRYPLDQDRSRSSRRSSEGILRGDGLVCRLVSPSLRPDTSEIPPDSSQSLHGLFRQVTLPIRKPNRPPLLHPDRAPRIRAPSSDQDHL
jgi:hypothetical protein